MDKDLKEIREFEAWTLAGSNAGLRGPFRTLGFNNHHFIDRAGDTQAVWHGDRGFGTVPAKSDPIFKSQPVTREQRFDDETGLDEKPTKTEKADGKG